MASFFEKLTGFKKEERLNDGAGEDSLSPGRGDWLDDNTEGQLSVDVYATADEIIIKSTIAGVKPEDVDVSINNDMLTIRGARQKEEEDGGKDYYYQECYWGAFSRSLILPVEVDADNVSASLKNGILTVRVPIAQKAKNVSVKIMSEG